MAKPERTEELSPAELRKIEELARQLSTPDWVLEGAKVHYDWGGGREMTEADYRKAVERFLRSPVGGDTK